MASSDGELEVKELGVGAEVDKELPTASQAVSKVQ